MTFIAGSLITGLRGKEAPYRYVDEDKLLDDFVRDVARIVEGKTMSLRRLYIGIRQTAEGSKALRDAMRRVASGDRTQQDSGSISRMLRSFAES
jgi:hypothetical protein